MNYRVFVNHRSFLVIAALGLLVFALVPGSSVVAPGSSTDTHTAVVERGQQLVTVGLCNDCHTPHIDGPQGPEPDWSRMLSGHPEDFPAVTPYTPASGSPWTVAAATPFTAWSGPWGVSFAANLTPDINTGLRSGVWTRELFIKAMRTGKHMGTSREILPPMPWATFRKLSDEDLTAIWEYLGTIPAINNHVPEPIEPVATPRATD